MSRATRKRKAAQIEEDLSVEDSRPTKKQKITKKSSTKKKNIEEKDENTENEDKVGNESDEADATDVPPKLSKEELKAIALQKLLASNTINYREAREDEEYTLPDELLLQIFSHFRRRELTSLGLICRQWNRLSHDKSLGWHFVDSFYFEEQLDSYVYLAKDTDVTNLVTPAKFSQLWGHQRTEVAKSYRDAFLPRSPGSEPVTLCAHTYQYGNTTQLQDKDGGAIYFATEYLMHHINWSEVSADPDLWSYRIRKLSFEEAVKFCEDRKMRRPDNEVFQWVVDLEINIKRLEHLVATNEKIAGLQSIYNIVTNEASNNIKNISSTKNSSIPRRSFTAQQQPEGFKGEIKLYKYQLDAISWMKSVEQNNEGIPYFTAYSWPGAGTDLLFHKTGNNQQDIVVYNKSSNIDEVFDVLCPRGAILADEMGLGKTMEVIGLMLAVPASKKLPEHEKLFATRATLVLCPNHLVKQWSDEIEKTTALKVAVVATIVQLKKYTYEDLMDHDVVIASYQLFANLNYRDLRNKWIEYKSKSFAALRKRTPVLEQIYWHRLVLDEGHEYIDKDQFNRYFKSLFTRFAWYVTGTPFPTKDHFWHVKPFLGVQSSVKISQLEHIQTELMLRELYWRHTKVSVQGEYKVPDYVEDLVLVEFDEIEKVLYANLSQDTTQATLCGTLLHENTLDERLEHLIKKIEPSIKYLTERHIPAHVLQVQTAQYVYDNNTAVNRLAALERLEQSKKDLQRQQELLEREKKVLERALKATPFSKRDKKKVTEISRLTLQHGSKLAQMISYLKKLFEHSPGSRVIFFSQYDDKLSSVSQILTEHNIANVFVEGNVWKRTKALTNFKKDEDVKVIMLSLKNAASGTNLVEATHVILMDPVTGSKKEAQAIESQAIGRAFRQGQTKQITIVRFVVRNTIEHALYLRNNDVNEDTTVVVTKDNKPQLVRSSSNITLKRSGSVSNLLGVDNNNSSNLVAEKMTDN